MTYQISGHKLAEYKVKTSLSAVKVTDLEIYACITDQSSRHTGETRDISYTPRPLLVTPTHLYVLHYNQDICWKAINHSTI